MSYTIQLTVLLHGILHYYMFFIEYPHVLHKDKPKIKFSR